jgi:hypothetical protein
MTKTQFALVTEDFSYGASQDLAALKLSLSIFADRAHLRDQLRDDAQAAGFRIAEATSLAAFCEGDARPLGEVVLLDCPEANGAVLAALARIDMRAAHAGAALVVSTTVDALDDVFGCLDQSSPQILVNPSRAERLIALGQVLARLPGGRVRELSEEDRLVLLRLTEQVNQIAERMEQLGGPDGHGAFRPRTHSGHAPARGGDAGAGLPASPSAFSFGPALGLPPVDGDDSGNLIRHVSPALPDPKLVRRMIRQRQLRARFFDGDLFADPAWDMLLDLTAARAEQSRVSVTSLCIASGVPPTTALRWIGQMTEAGLLQRNEDKTDRRRAFITLTDKAADAMTGFFAQLGEAATRMI